MQGGLSMNRPDPTDVWTRNTPYQFLEQLKQQQSKSPFLPAVTMQGGSNFINNLSYIRGEMLPQEDGSYKMKMVQSQLDPNIIKKMGWQGIPIELAYNTPHHELNYNNLRMSEALRKLSDNLYLAPSHEQASYKAVLADMLKKRHTGSLQDFKAKGDINEHLELLSGNKKLYKQLELHSDYIQRMRMDAEAEFSRRTGVKRKYTIDDIAHQRPEVQQRYIQDKLKEALIVDGTKVRVDRDKLLKVEKEVAKLINRSNSMMRMEEIEDSWFSNLWKVPIHHLMNERENDFVQDVDRYLGKGNRDNAIGMWLEGAGRSALRAAQDVAMYIPEWVAFDVDNPHKATMQMIKAVRENIGDGEVIDLKDKNDWKKAFEAGGENFLNKLAKTGASPTLIGSGISAGATAGTAIFPGLGTLVGGLIGGVAGLIGAKADVLGYGPVQLMTGKSALNALGSQTAIDEVLTLVRNIYPTYTPEEIEELAGGDSRIKSKLQQQNKFAKMIEPDWTDAVVTMGKVGDIGAEVLTTFRGYGSLLKGKAITQARLTELGMRPYLYQYMPIINKASEAGIANRTMAWMSKMPTERFKILDTHKPWQQFFNRVGSMSEEGFKMWAVNEMLKNNPYADFEDVLTAGVTGSIFNWWSLGVGTAFKRLGKDGAGLRSLAVLDQDLKAFANTTRQELDKIGKNNIGSMFKKDLEEAQFQKAMLFGDLLIANTMQGLTMAGYEGFKNGSILSGFEDYFGKGEFMTDFISGPLIGLHIGIPKIKQARKLEAGYKAYEDIVRGGMKDIDNPKNSEEMDAIKRVLARKLADDSKPVVETKVTMPIEPTEKPVVENKVENLSKTMAKDESTPIREVKVVNEPIEDGDGVFHDQLYYTVNIGGKLYKKPADMPEMAWYIPSEDSKDVEKGSMLDKELDQLANSYKGEKETQFMIMPTPEEEAEMAMILYGEEGDKPKEITGEESMDMDIEMLDETYNVELGKINEDSVFDTYDRDIDEALTLVEQTPDISVEDTTGDTREVVKGEIIPETKEDNPTVDPLNDQKAEIAEMFNEVDNAVKATEIPKVESEGKDEPKSEAEDKNAVEGKVEGKKEDSTQEATVDVTDAKEQAKFVDALKRISDEDAKKALLALKITTGYLTKRITEKTGMSMERVNYIIDRMDKHEQQNKTAPMWVDTYVDDKKKVIGLTLNIVTDNTYGFDSLSQMFPHEEWHMFYNLFIRGNEALEKQYKDTHAKLVETEAWASAVAAKANEVYKFEMYRRIADENGISIQEAASMKLTEEQNAEIARLTNDEVMAEAYRMYVGALEGNSMDPATHSMMTETWMGVKNFLNRLTGDESTKRNADLIAYYNSIDLFQKMRKSKWAKRLNKMTTPDGKAESSAFFNIYTAFVQGDKAKAMVGIKMANMTDVTSDVFSSGNIAEADPLATTMLESDLNLYDQNAIVNRMEHGRWKNYDTFRDDVLKSSIIRKLDKNTKPEDFIHRVWTTWGPGTREPNLRLDITVEGMGDALNVKLTPGIGGSGGSMSTILNYDVTNPTPSIIGNDRTSTEYRKKSRGWTLAQDTISNVFSNVPNDSPLGQLVQGFTIGDLHTVENFSILRDLNDFYDVNGDKFTPEYIRKMGKEPVAELGTIYDINRNRITGAYRINENGHKDPKGQYVFNQMFKFDHMNLGDDMALVLRAAAEKGFFPTLASDKANSMIGMSAWMDTVSQKFKGLRLTQSGIQYKNINGNRDTFKETKEGFHPYIVALESQLVKHILRSEYMKNFGLDPQMFVAQTKDGESIDILDYYDITLVNGKYKLSPTTKPIDENTAKKVADAIKTVDIAGVKEAIDKVLQAIDDTSGLIENYNLRDRMKEATKGEFDESLTVAELFEKFEGMSDKMQNVALRVLSDFYKDKLIAMVDTFQAMAIDPSGSSLFYHTVDSGGKARLNKYLHKYATYVRYEQTPMNWKNLSPIFEEKGWAENGVLTDKVRGFTLENGELFINTYVFDPSSWEKLASNLEATGLEANMLQAMAIREMLEIAGEDAIDGASLTLNGNSTNTDYVNPHEILSLIGGAKPRGSLKTRAMIKEGQNASPLKHAIHPEYLTDMDEVGESMGAKLYDALQRSLMANNIGMITFTSAIKGNGVYKPTVKESIDGKYKVTHKGERTAFIDTQGKEHKIGTRTNVLTDPATKQQIVTTETAATNPQLLTETPYMTFLPSELGFVSPQHYKAYNGGATIATDPSGKVVKFPFKAPDLKKLKPEKSTDYAGHIKIPVSGQLGMSWDSQVGDPHSFAASLPFRLASFTRHSKYMQIPEDIKKELIGSKIETGEDIVKNFFNNYNQDLASVYKGYTALMNYVHASIQGKPVDGIKDADLIAMYDFLDDLARTLKMKMRDDEGIWEETEEGDFDRTNRALLERYDLQRELDIVYGVLENVDKSSITSLRGMMSKLPSLALMSDVLVENKSGISNSRAGQGTAAWKALANKMYHAFMGRPLGSISVLDSDRHAKGDMVRMSNYYSTKALQLIAEGKGETDEAKLYKELAKVSSESDAMFVNQHGIYHEKSQGISISPDLMEKHGLNFGDKVFVVLTPSDSIQSMVPMVVTGLLPMGKRNTLTFNKHLALKLLGRDHDIDKMSLVVYGKKKKFGQKRTDKLWDVETIDTETGGKSHINTFDILHKTLTHHGIHEGRAKNKITNLRDKLSKTTKETPIKRRGKEIPVNVPFTNPMADEAVRNDSDFKNTYTQDLDPILSTLSADDAIKSRLKFGEKAIGVFAKVGNDYGMAISRLPKLGIRTSIDPAKLLQLSLRIKHKGMEISPLDAELLKKVSFEFGFDEGKFDALFPYQKEGAVDIFSKHPYKLDPYEWLVEFGIQNIKIGDGEAYSNIAALKDDTDKHRLLPYVKELLNMAMEELVHTSQSLGDPAGATKQSGPSDSLKDKNIIEPKNGVLPSFPNVQLVPNSADDAITKAFTSKSNPTLQPAYNIPLLRAKDEKLAAMSAKVIMMSNTLMNRNVFSLNGKSIPLSAMAEFNKGYGMVLSHAVNIFSRLTPEAAGFDARINDFLTNMLYSDLVYYQSVPEFNKDMDKNPERIPALNEVLSNSIAPYAVMKSYFNTLLNLEYEQGSMNSQLFKVDVDGKFIYNEANPYKVFVRQPDNENHLDAYSDWYGYELFTYVDKAGEPIMQFKGSKTTEIPLKDFFGVDGSLHPELLKIIEPQPLYTESNGNVRMSTGLLKKALEQHFLENISNTSVTIDRVKIEDVNKFLAEYGYKVTGTGKTNTPRVLTELTLPDTPEGKRILANREGLNAQMKRKMVGYLVDALINNGSQRMLTQGGKNTLEKSDRPAALGPIYYNLRGTANKEKFVVELISSLVNEYATELGRAKNFTPKEVEFLKRQLAGYVLTTIPTMDAVAGALGKMQGNPKNRLSAKLSASEQKSPVNPKQIQGLIDILTHIESMDVSNQVKGQIVVLNDLLKQAADGTLTKMTTEDVLMTAYDLFNTAIQDPNLAYSEKRNTVENQDILDKIMSGQEAALHLFETYKASGKTRANRLNFSNLISPPVIFGLTPQGRKLAATFRANGIDPVVNISRKGNVFVPAERYLTKVVNAAMAKETDVSTLTDYRKLRSQYFIPSSEKVEMLQAMSKGKRNGVIDALNHVYRKFITTAGMKVGRLTNLDEFEQSFNNYTKGKVWENGTEITFTSFFGDMPYYKSSSPQDAATAKEIVKNFVYHELANVLDMPGVERSALKEKLDKLGDVYNPEDYIAHLVHAQINKMSSFYGDLLDTANRYDPESVKYYLNDMAIQVFNMYKQVHGLKKAQAKAVRNRDLINADNDTAKRLLREANIFEMNTPWALAQSFSNHKGLYRPSDIIFSYVPLSVDMEGNVTKDETHRVSITASIVKQGGILPTSSAKTPIELQKATEGTEARVFDPMPFVELTLPEVVMSIGKHVMNLKEQNKAASNIHIQGIMDKQAQATGLKQEAQIAKVEQAILDNFIELFPNLKMKYNMYDGKVHPYFEYSYTDAQGISHTVQGQLTAKGEFTQLVDAMMRELRIKSSFTKSYNESVKGLENVEKAALEKALSIKLYNAHKAVQAQEQLSLVSSMVNTIAAIRDRGGMEDTHMDSIRDMAQGLIEDLQYIIKMGDLSSDESRSYMPFRTMSVSQELMMMQDIYGKTVKEVEANIEQTGQVTLDNLSPDVREFLGTFAKYIGKDNLTDYNVYDVAERLEQYVSELTEKNDGFTPQDSMLMTFLRGMQNNSKSLVRSQRYINELRQMTPDSPMYLSAEMVNKYDEAIGDSFNKVMGDLLVEYYKNREQVEEMTLGVEENSLTRDETLGFLTHLTNETKIYSTPIEIHEGKLGSIPLYSSVDMKYMKLQYKYNQETKEREEQYVDARGKGLYLGKSQGYKNDYHVIMKSDGKLEFVLDGMIEEAIQGQNLKWSDRMIQDGIADILRNGITESTLKEAVTAHELVERGRIIKGAEGRQDVTEGFKRLRNVINEVQGKMKEYNPTLSDAIKRAPSVTIGLQYLGGIHALKASLGLVGGLSALILSPVVPGASNAAMGLLGLGFGSLASYGENMVKRVFQNVFSNFRTLYELEGFKITKETVGTVLKSVVNESQKGIMQATQTFYQSEFDAGNILKQMPNSKIDQLVDLLTVAKSSLKEIAEGQGKNLDNIQNLILSGDMKREDLVKLVDAAKLAMKNRVATEKIDGVSVDILEMIDMMKYNPITKEFVTAHGQDIAALMELRRGFMEQVTEGMGNLSSIIPLSEELTRQLAQNSMAKRLLSKQFDERYTPEEIVEITKNMINISGGEYGMHTRTVLGNSELGRFLTMYGRFSKNNAVYYLNHIWDRVDEQMFLDKLSDLNSTSYGKIGEGYARIASMGHMENLRAGTSATRDSKVLDFDYIKAVQRKLALGTTIAFASQLAKVGMSALGIMLAGTWFGEALGEDEDRKGGLNPIREFESMTGIGGSYSGAIETMMALGSVAFLREGDILENKNINKSTFDNYWREMITAPGRFLFTTGIGSGYAGIGGLLMGTSFNTGAYLVRDKMGRTGELMDGAFKNGFYQLGNQTLGGFPFLSPYYNLGMGAYGVYNKGVRKGSDHNVGIIEETFGDEE